MIIVGYTAYEKAAEGMNQKFQESTQQTINMAMNYMDMSCTYVQSEGFRYAVDSALEEFFIGMLKKVARAITLHILLLKNSQIIIIVFSTLIK